MNQTVSCLEIPCTAYKYSVRTSKRTLRAASVDCHDAYMYIFSTTDVSHSNSTMYFILPAQFTSSHFSHRQYTYIFSTTDVSQSGSTMYFIPSAQFTSPHFFHRQYTYIFSNTDVSQSGSTMYFIPCQLHVSSFLSCKLPPLPTNLSTEIWYTLTVLILVSSRHNSITDDNN